ncbi:Hypothetical protein HPV225_0874 [Helicobacter pylori v225d]|nr:Hypothetical protein HPV225_0874 [Helicobacter pylori v225d]
MKPQDIKIIQSVLEIIKEPIKVTEIYHKAQELFEKGEIESMFDYGGNTPDQSVSASIYTALNKGEDLPFLKVQEKPVSIALKSTPKEPVLNAQKPSAPSVKIAHERDLHPFLTYMAFFKPPKQKSQTSLVFGMNALVPLGTIKNPMSKTNLDFLYTT